MSNKTKRSSGTDLGVLAVIGAVLCCALPLVIGAGMLATIGAFLRSPLVIVTGIAGLAAVSLWALDAAGRVRGRERRVLREVPTQTAGERNGPMRFMQIIEFKTSKIDELNAALDEWLAQTKGQRAAQRGTQTRDRDVENTYVQIVEFPSYEEAMANSKLPETSAFAERLAALCDSPPTFRNLDVLREETM